jgi:type I restriction enzyme S subunit
LENGKTAFVDFLHDGGVGWGSTEYIVLRPKGGIPAVYAYLLARTEDFRAFATRQMTGSSGRQRVPPMSLSKYPLALPPIESPIFAAFGEIVEPLFRRMRIDRDQNHRLAGLRDALLPKLLSGEIDIPKVGKMAEAAI